MLLYDIISPKILTAAPSLYDVVVELIYYSILPSIFMPIFVKPVIAADWPSYCPIYKPSE